MSDLPVIKSIQDLPAYKKMVEAIKAGTGHIHINLPRSVRLPLAVALYHDLNRPMCLITDRADRSLVLVDEINFWSPIIGCTLFPEPTPLFYEQAGWGMNTRRERLRTLTSLASYQIPGRSKETQPPFIVTPIRAVMVRTLPRREFLKACKTIKIGDQITPEYLIQTWVGLGYQPADTVLEPGFFSRRGGIIDVWAVSESKPIRLEFFGNEIDTIRTFEPSTQRTMQSLDRVMITPAKEILVGQWNDPSVPDELHEFYIPVLHKNAGSMLEYLPSDTVVLIDDGDLIQTTVFEIEEQAIRLRKDSIQEGTLPEDFPIPYLTWAEIQDEFDSNKTLEFSWGSDRIIEQEAITDSFIPGPRFGGRLKDFLDFLLACSKNGEQVIIASRQCSRLQAVWDERLVNENFNSILAPIFREGNLSEGWTLNLQSSGKLYLLTDSEVFGWGRPTLRKQPQPVAEAPETEYADLRPGDFVVHVDYGIGKYAGLVQRSLEGKPREYLCVEYEDGDQLFVPIHQADRLSRYIGPDSRPPSLSRLSGETWNESKEEARKAVMEVAHDLLDIYARRSIAKGYSFGKDNQWQEEMESSFPYIETEDQLRAIEEVKRDMESDKPMDRLLCGDVGYGKTEVALRAAFKAVLDGKQVAMLVPTTVLAQQHFETFRRRLSVYPVEVEMLSRFRTAKEQVGILTRLREGKIDIVIGTHRLIQSDVEFMDLGLVIIDEEQRFGVTHKEFFKRLRTEIDVLTLTATPIPRTLYMALTGVRDISTINTPPEERLSIITHVGPYSPKLVRQAIVRELERGGQVFFVHNRVQTIHGMERHLLKLVPEARVGIAHGQMPEGDLAAVMEKFSGGDIDVLLCTSIIESGLDIPNANTLIVDRGDTFGLAQLYQLRGRVGRGAQRAYAYFFRHRKKPPTPEGQERLEVIAENTQLGAGYSIAMRDLEMRGAGELLGTQQHGYIAAVGFHMYTSLLTQAVRQLRGAMGIPINEEMLSSFKENQIPVSVELPLAIGIPTDYVADQNMRLKLYRRLADLQNLEEVHALREEFIDRFGPLPKEVLNLYYQLEVKILSQKIGLVSISVESNQLVLRYPALPDGVMSRNLPMYGSSIRAGKNAYWMQMDKNEDIWMQNLMDVLTLLSENNRKPLTAER